MDKKKVIIIVSVVAVVVLLAVGGVALFIGYQNKQKAEEQALLEKQALEAEQNNEVEDNVTVWTVKANKGIGEEIKENDLVELEMNAVEAEEAGAIENIHALVGNYYMNNVVIDEPLTSENTGDLQITPDMRKYDIILDKIPIGLEEGDYIDVRIKFTMGQDFIALRHKKVAEINTEVLKLYCTQEDIAIYNSMLLDQSIYTGTETYATEYIDEAQDADIYYPVRFEILTQMLQDPNLKDEDGKVDVREVTAIERSDLEEDLIVSDSLSSAITASQAELRQIYAEAKNAYDSQVAALKEQEEAQAAAGSEVIDDENVPKVQVN